MNILEETTIFSSEQNQIRKIIGIEYRQQNLTCHFDANPPPTSIYWITNGTTIVSRKQKIDNRQSERCLQCRLTMFYETCWFE